MEIVRKKLSDKFMSFHIAHRGLHGEGVCENSMEAFRRAIESGYGIELDVHLTKDNKLCVIHDSYLSRMTDKPGVAERLTSEELEKYLMEPGVYELIQKYGYTDMQVERVLAHLSDRIRGFNRKGMGFPHEIGVFLGYPLDDVKGFIENAGKKYLQNKKPDYDAIVAMYHDQGLCAVKALTGNDAVNTTIGLKVIRTSPSSGTAYDIKGKNIANPDGMIDAIRLLLKLI